MKTARQIMLESLEARDDDEDDMDIDPPPIVTPVPCDTLAIAQQEFDPIQTHGPRIGISRKRPLERHIKYKGVDAITGTLLKYCAGDWWQQVYTMSGTRSPDYA